MRDVGVFSAEYSVGGRFINEAVNLSILLTVKGYDIGWLGMAALYISGLVTMGLMGGILRRAEIPHLTNTLQNEMNVEQQRILKNTEEMFTILKNMEKRLNKIDQDKSKLT